MIAECVWMVPRRLKWRCANGSEVFIPSKYEIQFQFNHRQQVPALVVFGYFGFELELHVHLCDQSHLRRCLSNPNRALASDVRCPDVPWVDYLSLETSHSPYATSATSATMFDLNLVVICRTVEHYAARWGDFVEVSICEAWYKHGHRLKDVLPVCAQDETTPCGMDTIQSRTFQTADYYLPLFAVMISAPQLVVLLC